MTVTLSDIRAAADAISGAVLRTPMHHSRTLSVIAGAEVYLKFENRQFTASFKERGALNRLLTLDAIARVRGVVGPLKPNWEIADIMWAYPAAPPTGCTPATARRLAELRGAPVSPHW